MKTYIAKFWRGNPQLRHGGYYTTYEIEAKTIRSAEKKARKYEDCVYGTMSLVEIQEAEA